MRKNQNLHPLLILSIILMLLAEFILFNVNFTFGVNIYVLIPILFLLLLINRNTRLKYLFIFLIIIPFSRVIGLSFPIYSLYFKSLFVYAIILSLTLMYAKLMNIDYKGLFKSKVYLKECIILFLGGIVFGILEYFQINFKNAINVIDPVYWYVLFLFTVFVQEFLLRGFIQNLIEEKIGKISAAIYTSIFITINSLFLNSPIFIATILVESVIASLVYAKYRSLYLSMLFNWTINATIIMITVIS